MKLKQKLTISLKQVRKNWKSLVALISIVISVVALIYSHNANRISQRTLELQQCPILRMEAPDIFFDKWKLKNEGPGVAINIFYSELNFLATEEKTFVITVPRLMGATEPARLNPSKNEIININFFSEQAERFSDINKQYKGKIIKVMFLSYQCENTGEVKKKREYYRFSEPIFRRIPYNAENNPLIKRIDDYITEHLLNDETAVCINYCKSEKCQFVFEECYIDKMISQKLLE